ncbi:MAG TPA: hypothetical protein VFQ70_03570, partial [Candidatus Saccharimonadaceae bacterium]|nr:hypothetical protein [Candidatus Saccharimonadaceae bacterium]
IEQISNKSFVSDNCTHAITQLAKIEWEKGSFEKCLAWVKSTIHNAVTDGFVAGYNQALTDAHDQTVPRLVSRVEK